MTKPLIFSSLSLALVTIVMAIYLGLTRNPKPLPVSPPLSPTPTASPSATPTPKPLSFQEMNQLYGPCVHLPVLMYHHVQNNETAKQNGNSYLTVSPENFEKQLKYLNNQRYTSIDPTDLITFFNQGQSLPKRPILLTFDDGYDDFANYAVPLLNRYGFQATVFVPSGLMDNSGYLSWSMIKNLPTNIYIGNHTWSHQNMATNLDTIKKEITTANTQLTERGLDPAKVFAYPYGATSPKTVNFLQEAGFQLAFTTVPGKTLCAKQRLNLPRVRVGNTPSLAFYGL